MSVVLCSRLTDARPITKSPPSSSFLALINSSYLTSSSSSSWWSHSSPLSLSLLFVNFPLFYLKIVSQNLQSVSFLFPCLLMAKDNTFRTVINLQFIKQLCPTNLGPRDLPVFFMSPSSECSSSLWRMRSRDSSATVRSGRSFTGHRR